MRVINFLPGDYLEKRSRRKANVVCLIMAGGSLLLAAAIVGVAVVRAAATAAMRGIIEQQYREASRRIDQLKELESRKAGLLRKVDLSADLLERVPRSHVVARLCNALPDHTTIQLLSMAPKDVVIEGSAEPAKSGRKRGSARAAVARRKVTEVRFKIEGLAETDVAVADYINRLSRDPFFGELNLEFSEEFPFDEEVNLRRFAIIFKLLPEAKRLLETPVEEPAPAKPEAEEPPVALSDARGES